MFDSFSKAELREELQQCRSYVIPTIPEGDRTNDYWRSRVKALEVELATRERATREKVG